MVPPHIHIRNADEGAIRTFKAHFLSILAGIAKNPPKNLWDLLIPQTELTLNLLRQSTLNPKIYVWECFQGPFDYNATTIGTLVSQVMIHRKTSTRKSWEFRGKEVWSIVVDLDHYQFQSIIPQNTKAEKISNTVDLHHQTITTPVGTSEDRITHGITTLTDDLTDAPTDQSDAQL